MQLDDGIAGTFVSVLWDGQSTKEFVHDGIGDTFVSLQLCASDKC